MKRKNNELKMLANLAKHRLLKADYVSTKDDYKPTKTYASSYFIKNAQAMRKLKAETEYVTITNNNDDDFVKSVVSMISSGTNEYNPLGKLSDNDYFNKLGDVEKQFYILMLSDKYNRVKNMIESRELDVLKIS